MGISLDSARFLVQAHQAGTGDHLLLFTPANNYLDD
jgi:hypothetical protein